MTLALFAASCDFGGSRTRGSFEELVTYGNRAEAAGDDLAAVAWYDEALGLKADHHCALYFRGRALAALGRIDEAKTDFARAREAAIRKLRSSVVGEVDSHGVGLIEIVVAEREIGVDTEAVVTGMPPDVRHAIERDERESEEAFEKLEKVLDELRERPRGDRR